MARAGREPGEDNDFGCGDRFEGVLQESSKTEVNQGFSRSGEQKGTSSKKISGIVEERSASTRKSSSGSCGSGRKERWRRAATGRSVRPERERPGGAGIDISCETSEDRS